ncbi:asparagine synthase (glutamine-hydrolyzing) [Kiloniella sp. EL199]|uniref:asparagine synthase (glutamine-hydrolyzing) n=1 Tax=Kiloniella sp. EL199 TaxID=2107581 RepID=UPI000EA1AEB6|nr:asparagine synthase (glutamine-hydrolyzing) [Kiloniella sp. EL199]
MCGIAGFIDGTINDTNKKQSIAHAMGEAMYRRGPDGGEVWIGPDNGVAFAHRRLSIIDLSSAGQQPMISSCGRYVLVYNGEIYNAAQIRAKIISQYGINFKGYSDTEVLLEAIANWGIKDTLDHLIGMFVFAVWDKKLKRLTLCRDRVGIKPLYWSYNKGAFIFGSILKALKKHPKCPTQIDQNSIASFLRFNYIPAPHSIYQNVQKLLPGHILTFDVDGDKTPKLSTYWSLDQAVRQGQNVAFSGTENEAITTLEELLEDAVAKRMISDVPFGAFLSGGIDSSTVAALMQKQSSSPIKTFSIGFEDQAYNEAQHAAQIAKHLGTEHTELYVTPAEARATIPNLADIYDEPFADSSQIPTYLVSKLTRDHVTVALSGDGGDELFGGYRRHITAHKYGNNIRKLPRFIGALSSGIIQSLSPQAWDKIFKIVPDHKRPSHSGDTLYKLASVLGETSDGYYRKLVSNWQNPDSILRSGHEYHGILWDQTIEQFIPNNVERMQYLDTLTYLPDDILTKVDRASMAASLEARVPLLDHRVVEFSWSLPMHMKIRDGQGKWVLRKVLDKYVPAKLIDRPKMGFGIPIDHWLRGPLKEWAQDLLSQERLDRSGLIDGKEIQEKLQQHQAGSRNWQYKLWAVLMLQSWLEHN